MRRKTNKTFSLVIMIICCFFFQTTAYSLLSSSLTITGDGYARVGADVRITDFRLASTNNAISSYEEFGKNHIITEVNLIDSSSYITYYYEVTNYSSVDVGIFDITGLPEEVNYTINNYNLKDKICDSVGKCNSFIKNTYEIVLSTTSSYSGVVQLNFDFRIFHNVTYENIAVDSNYPTSVIDGGNLNFNFLNNDIYPLFVYIDNNRLDSNMYTYENGSINIDDVNGDVLFKSTNSLYEVMSLSTNGLDTSINFGIASSSTNGNGINTVNGTENNEYPIYYYRGTVDNNNVLFANICWKIVRTTDTGGIKLIYNGLPALDGSCNNTGTASQIGTSVFNESHGNGIASLADVSYMFGDVYLSTKKDFNQDTATYVYGNDVKWDGTNYTLVDTVESSDFANDYNSLALKYHYTCLNSTGICSSVHYVYSFNSGTNYSYYFTLSDGYNIESAKENMFSPVNDSSVKKVIDEWYENNLVNYTNKLEDTIWCNDKSFHNGAIKSKDSSGIDSGWFEAGNRNASILKPSLSCSNKIDRYTVDNADGNKALKYPIALLTADELTYAGSGRIGHSDSAYLHTGQYWRTMTPFLYQNANPSMFVKHEESRLTYYPGSNVYGVRPAISLKVGTIFTSGNGTVSNPFIID